MSTFNEATTKPTAWTQDEIDNTCATIVGMINDPREAVAALGFLSSQNEGISKATNDAQIAKYLEIQTINRMALFDALADNEEVPVDFLPKVAARFGLEFASEDEPELVEALDLNLDLNVEPAPEPA